MFHKDFFPTPIEVIETMLHGETINGKIILEPHAGKGNIVDYLNNHWASKVLACEINKDLQQILKGKCTLIAEDFLALQAHHISHVDMIIMNPPFSNIEKHILHAWEIAPEGCRIITLSDFITVDNPHTKDRAKIQQIIEENGNWEDLGECFKTSERKTNVKVALIKLAKPHANSQSNYNKEFEGFFMEQDQPEAQENGIMPYNVVRDMVNRYVEAVKLFDKQLELAQQMNEITGQFFSQELAMEITEDGKPKTRNDFKKQLQKSGWNFIFEKMNMQKYATRGLKQDINTFVETQEKIPFTMKNIYHMIQIVVGTQEQRMDKALLEVFEKLTQHYDENRYNVEGWKTNSHYLINQKFIMPYMCPQSKWSTSNKIDSGRSSSFELIEDLLKALCYINGDNYDKYCGLDRFLTYTYKIYINDKYETITYDMSTVNAYKKEAYEEGKSFRVEEITPQYGQLFDWSYFTIRAYKKGTMHFKFKDEDVWARFNQRIAKLKGYPLFEHVKTRKPAKNNKKAQKQESAS